MLFSGPRPAVAMEELMPGGTEDRRKVSGDTYTVGLRIFGEKLDPSEVTNRVALEPCQTRLAGSRRSANSVYKNGMWAYNGLGAEPEPPEWESLEDALTFVLDKVWDQRKAIAGYKADCAVWWWCGHFQSSFDNGPLLSASLLARLGEFGADLFIDNYFLNDEE